MKTNIKSLFLALPLAITSIAFAQHQTFKVNPDASQVAFSLGGNAHHVDGSFHVQSGEIDFDRGAQVAVKNSRFDRRAASSSQGWSGRHLRHRLCGGLRCLQQ